MTVWTVLRELPGGLVLASNSSTGLCERIPAASPGLRWPRRPMPAGA